MGLPNASQSKAEIGEDISDDLPPGTQLLHGQYTIVSFLNAGGFGITYNARDSLDRKVVIKECFPGAFCRRSRTIVQARSRAHQSEFTNIVRLFVEEARSLSKLNHPNIVGVHQIFEENDTAYMALDFVTGRDLLEILEDPAIDLPPERVVSILRDLLKAIGFVHSEGVLHRDISPDNILIDNDMNPVLIDFGAARQQAKAQGKVMSALRVVKDGYSPQEFYITGSEQGPYSDLYALAASFYHVIANEVPPDSQRRLSAIASNAADPYQPLKGRFPAYDNRFLAAIDHALAILPKDRIQSAEAWLAEMDAPTRRLSRKVVPAAHAPAPRRRLPMMIGAATVMATAAGAFWVMQPDPSASVAGNIDVTADLSSMSQSGAFARTIAPAASDPVGPATTVMDVAPPESPAPVVVATAPTLVTVSGLETTASAPVAVWPDFAPVVLTPAGARIASDPTVNPVPVIASEPAAAPMSAPEPDPFLAGGWSVTLPFDDLRLDAEEAGRIVSVNGTPVADRAAFDRVLRNTYDLRSLTALTLEVGLAADGGAAARTRSVTLPVAHDVTVSDGLTFRSTYTDGTWTTRVVALPDPGQTDLRTDLRVGDTVFASVDIGQALEGPTALRRILETEITGGRSTFRFAVLRENSNWVATLVRPLKN